MDNKRKLCGLLIALALLPGCKTRESGVKGFWDEVPLIEEDIHISEDRFADFAELAVDSPEKDALAALDKLFDRLSEDEVAYYVYSGWMEEAFYSVLSPCRNYALFSHAVQRMNEDAVIDEYTRERLLRDVAWMEYNQVGSPAIIPGVATPASRTLVLLLDVGCPSCRDALERMTSDPQWKDLSHVAVLFGLGSKPDMEGWDSISLAHPEAIFDPGFTPVYFIVSADGLVEQSYTPVM